MCGHASGTVCEYVEEAVKRGLEVIGISDHCAPPIGTSEPYFTPLNMREKYLSQIEEARKKYGGRIKILAAAEMEYYNGYDGYYANLLKELDYLVLGQHEFLLDGERVNSFTCEGSERNLLGYCEHVMCGLRTGMFSILAHPDMIFHGKTDGLPQSVLTAFESIVAEATARGVALELNANGIRSHSFKYPTDLLIKLCLEYGSSVVISSDNHSPECLCDEHVLNLYAYAQKVGLKIKNEIKLYNS